MIIYSLTYAINALSTAVKKKDEKILRIIVFLLLIFMSGTRYYMGGSDVYTYENVYNGVPQISAVLKYIFTGVNEGVNINYESGYILLCSIGRFLHLSYFGFLLGYSTLFYVLLYNGLKGIIEEWGIFLALFMYKLMFYNTFISIRQGMTLAVFCYALKYMISKNPVRYMLCCLVAFYIHRGAIILFPLYFAQYIPMSKKILRNLAIGFAPTWFLRNLVDLSGLIEKVISVIGFEQKSEGWSEALESISIIHTLECYIIIIFCIIFYDRIAEFGRKGLISLKLVIFTLPIFTLCSNWIVLTREKDYFVLFYGILLGYIVVSRKLDLSIRLIIKRCILIAGFIGMVRYVLVFDGGVLWHFTSFIFKGCSIFS